MFSGHSTSLSTTVRALQECGDGDSITRERILAHTIQSLSQQQKYSELLYFLVLAAELDDSKQASGDGFAIRKSVEIVNSLSSHNFYLAP